jgi:hypothetical protein
MEGFIGSLAEEQIRQQAQAQNLDIKNKKAV